MKPVYDFGIRLYSLGVLLVSFFNSKAKLWVDGRKGIFQKLQASVSGQDQPIWFHCASLGEFEQGRPLIELIRSQFPNEKILLTFFSPSGYELKKNYPEADYVFYLPLDTIKNARRFINIVKPKMVFFVKYEFWFNYIDELSKNQIPLYLVSGIFRNGQLFFKWYGSYARKRLTQFTHLFLQNEASKKLVENIGIKNYSVSGDTRFDRAIQIRNGFESLHWIEQFAKNSRTLVVGSSWEEDEKLIYNYIKTSKTKDKLILVPHEVSRERVNKLKSLFEELGPVLYSEKENTNSANTQVLIIDVMGLLSRVYHYAHTVFIGGGFGSGIHNLLEPACFGKPVFFGPNYHNFKEAHDLIGLGGGKSIQTGKELLKEIGFLKNSDQYDEISKKISDYVLQNTGASKKIVDHVFKN